MSYFEIQELLDEAESLSLRDPQRCDLGRQAERIAIDEGDIHLLFRVRAKLVYFLSYSDRLEELLVSTAWCFQNKDLVAQLPSYERYSFFWNLKNAFRNFDGLPTITLSQLDNMLQQLESLYSEYGHGNQVIYLVRALTAISTGRLNDLETLRIQVATTPRDQMSDCLACETDHRVKFATVAGEFESAVEIAQPLLTGEQSCAEVPERTYSRLLMPLLRLGREQEAKEMHQAGWPKVVGEIPLPESAATHLGFAVRDKDLGLAFRIFEANICRSMAITDHLKRYFVLVAAEYLFEACLEKGLPKPLSIDLSGIPVESPLRADKLASLDERELVEHLHETFGRAARDIASKFDRRNGNDYVSRQVRSNIRFEGI